MDRKNFIEQAAQITRRAYKFGMKGRKQGLAELGGDIDPNALKNSCIFELGIRLAVEGVDAENIGRTLNGMIDREKDETKKRLKTIQREAVKCIQDGSNSFILLNIIFSFLNDDEKKSLRGQLTDGEFKDYFANY